VEAGEPALWPDLPPVRPADVHAIAELLARAERPALIGGRGAALAGAGPAIQRLGELSGAILATSAVANGLFADDPFAVGISGGFATPTGARLMAEADVIVAFGASLNNWTTRHGALVEDAKLVQVDRDAEAIGAHRAVDHGLVGDARETAEALIAALTARREQTEVGGAARRSVALAAEIAGGAWRDVTYDGSRDWLDPRDLTIALDELLPLERTVVVDSGAFMGYPSMYLRVPDAAGFVFPQAFQCVGLALGNAIGAAVARPDRLTVCAVGDGGLLMSLPDLETLGRERPDMLVVIYDDAAYGAEVHHFRPMGIPVELAQFPPTDFAALAEAAGCRGVTARTVEDLDAVRSWLENRDRPLVLDAKVDPNICAEWLEEAFRGH
jgi:thiamine pyrophosphate-dependent acetolactate synthase large subunit-like protein